MAKQEQLSPQVWADRHEGMCCRIQGNNKTFYITGGQVHDDQVLRELESGAYEFAPHAKLKIDPDIKSQKVLLKEIMTYLHDDKNEYDLMTLYERMFKKRLRKKKGYSKHFVEIW